jgi:hypothetical protein
MTGPEVAYVHTVELAVNDHSLPTAADRGDRWRGPIVVLSHWKV